MMKRIDKVKVAAEQYNKFAEPMTHSILKMFKEKELEVVVSYCILKDLIYGFEKTLPELKQCWDISQKLTNLLKEGEEDDGNKK